MVELSEQEWFGCEGEQCLGMVLCGTGQGQVRRGLAGLGVVGWSQEENADFK